LSSIESHVARVRRLNTEAWQTPEAYAELMNLIPYKRIGESGEIGQTAVWLASDFTDYIVGSTIYIRWRDDVVSRFRNRRVAP
jgi:NAD(P)-dependent dehydrogenase (short-subunit alcohol dehydrogenase family)